MLNGIHGHQDIERVVYGKPAGPALRAEAERLGASVCSSRPRSRWRRARCWPTSSSDLGDRYAGVYAGITAHSPRPCVIEGAQAGARGQAPICSSRSAAARRSMPPR